MAKKQDDSNPMEAEILREVAEEMKEEQLKQVWKKYSSIFITFVLVAIIGTGGFEFFKYRQEQQASQDANELQTALVLIEDGNGEEGAELLRQLRENSKNGYRYLAALHYVDYLLQLGDETEAVAGLDYIISDKNTPTPIKNMSLFNKVSIAIDMESPDYTALESDLNILIADDGAWTANSLELAAVIALRQNDTDKAKARLQQMVSMPGLSDARRQRAMENLSLLTKNAE